MPADLRDKLGRRWFYHSCGECDRCHMDPVLLFECAVESDPSEWLFCKGCIEEIGKKMKRGA